MFELAEKILELTRSKSRIVFQILPEDDPKQQQPDIRLGETSLDWFPKVGLEYGLKATIGYFRELRQDYLQLFDISIIAEVTKKIIHSLLLSTM